MTGVQTCALPIYALYEACKPEIVTRRKEYLLKDVIHYLREVIDGKADRGNLDNAKRRISQLLDESILAEEVEKDKKENATNDLSIVAEKNEYYIKSWKQIDLSKLNIEKLKEEYKQAPYKNIEIADLRAFIAGKLQQMIERNVSRISFAQRLQEIDRKSVV